MQNWKYWCDRGAMPTAFWFTDVTWENMKPPGAGSSFPNFKGPSLLKWIHRSKTGSQAWGSPGWRGAWLGQSVGTTRVSKKHPQQCLVPLPSNQDAKLNRWQLRFNDCVFLLINDGGYRHCKLSWEAGSWLELRFLPDVCPYLLDCRHMLLLASYLFSFMTLAFLHAKYQDTCFGGGKRGPVPVRSWLF